MIAGVATQPPLAPADNPGMFIPDRPELILWIEALLVRTRRPSIDPWALARVETLLVREGWRARARG